jgi:hypothetical protein
VQSRVLAKLGVKGFAKGDDVTCQIVGIDEQQQPEKF